MSEIEIKINVSYYKEVNGTKVYDYESMVEDFESQLKSLEGNNDIRLDITGH